MKFLTQNFITVVLVLATMATVLFSTNALAKEPVYLGMGGKVGASNWQGNNDGNSDAYQASAGQIGLNISVLYKSFYSGLSIQGGTFDFKNGSPDRIDKDGNTETSNAEKVGRSEFDLVAGYYFWSKVSLFLDLKAVGYDWIDLEYRRTSYGLGFGVSGFIPLSDKWSLYGSAGIVPLSIQTEGKKIGDGIGTALTFSAQYKITPHEHISFNSNFQSHEYNFDNDEKQTYTISSVVFGYNYYFSL